MARAEEIKIETPLGFFAPKIETQKGSITLCSGVNNIDGLHVSVYVQDKSVNLLDSSSTDGVCLLQLSLKAKQELKNSFISFDLEDKKYDGIGEYESGEDFDSICWENKNHVAHLGFRNCIDQGKKKVDDFDSLEWQLPQKNNTALMVFLPSMQKSQKIEFNASFAWGRKNGKDDISTFIDADCALPSADWQK